MGRHLVAWCALWLVAGIAVFALAGAPAALAIVLVLFGASLSSPVRGRALLAAIAFACGMLDFAVRGSAPSAVEDAHFMRFPAVVIDARTSETFGSSLTLLMPGNVLALAETAGEAPDIGTRVLVRGKREPFDDARNPGEPSQRLIQAERGMVERLANATILARAPPDPGDARLWIPRARAWASARMHAALPEPEATILTGAMWGERGALAPDLRAEFQDTGTVHVLVTAGLHLGVVAALALGALRTLGCGRVCACLVTIACVWFYAALSGDHLPSQRAATMLSFGLLAHACGREALSWNALGAAAIAVAGFEPAAVTGLSFCLSFSCVAAIVAFARPIATRLEAALPHGVAEAAGVSLATQLGTWPLTAAAFLVIAPYAPLANLAVVPAVGVAMLAGFATLAATPVPPVAAACANIATTLVDWILGCVSTVAALPSAAIVATPPPPWTIATYDAALVLLAITLSRRRAVVPALAIVLVATALCLWPPRPARAPLTITAIDVGQADALLVQTPRGHAYLVDAGGKLEREASAGAGSAEAVGERIVVPFLIRAGIHHLDAVLLSHPHGDHAGGLPPVLRTLGAAAFADSGQTYPGHAYHDALDVAGQRHIPMLEPRGGDVWHTDDGVTFRFYGPTLPYIVGSRSDINSNSLVFRLEYGETRMLFTGDAGTETETRLLASGVDLRADVLKVGHHGSAYGTTPAFVNAVRPRVAIISVGRHNLFGHPASATIQALRSEGANVFRTDRNGAITVTSNGRTDTVEPFLH